MSDTKNKNISIEDIDNLLGSLPISKDKDDYDEIVWDEAYTDTMIKSKISLIELNSECFEISLEISNTSDQLYFVIFPMFVEEYFVFKNLMTNSVFTESYPGLLTFEKSINGQKLSAHQKMSKRAKFYFKDDLIENNIFDGIPFSKNNRIFKLYYSFEFTSDYFCPYSHIKFDDINKYSKDNKIPVWNKIIKTNTLEVDLSS
ncbi:MAG: hypothetical protein JXB48_22970 [Candidatus Latescibacteria bacterium]|nr:hypothetical protein [Candidatus Latescibacterota bacterium]